MAHFELERISVHGHDVCFRRGGSGPVLLLIHGMAGSSRSWKGVMPKLAERYSVIAPDLIGHGNSATPTGDYSLGAHASGLRDLLALLGIDRATIVGQSFGGGVAMQLTYQHPECCERLVLVDSGGLGREVSWILRLASVPGAEYVMPVLFPRTVWETGNAVARFFHQRGIRSERAAEIWRAYGSLTETGNRSAFVKTMRSVIDPGGQSVSAMDRLYLAAGVPTLIVWGEQDEIIPVSHAYAAHEAIPGSQLVVMDGVGHFPHSEQPDRFVDVLTDFMENTEPSHLTSEEIRSLLCGRDGHGGATKWMPDPASMTDAAS